MKETKKYTMASAKIILAIISIMLLGSCSAGGPFWSAIDGNGHIASETRDISGFHRVNASSATTVFITIGNSWHVEVITDSNLLEYVETSVRGNTLHVGNRNQVNLRPSSRLHVHITMPALDQVSASGASTVHIETILEQPFLSLRASGASDIYLTAHLEELEALSSGAADIRMSGYARHARVRASGASNFRGKTMICDFADIRLSGASDMTATIRKEVKGSMSGSSDLQMAGAPNVNVSTSGSSRIKRKDF